MTEVEYQRLPGFESLPLYDADDPRCKNLIRYHDPSYTGELIEAQEFDEAERRLSERDLVPKGGIREDQDGTTVVFAYFWRTR